MRSLAQCLWLFDLSRGSDLRLSHGWRLGVVKRNTDAIRVELHEHVMSAKHADDLPRQLICEAYVESKKHRQHPFMQVWRPPISLDGWLEEQLALHPAANPFSINARQDRCSSVTRQVFRQVGVDS
jgi:hypothetical protein